MVKDFKRDFLEQQVERLEGKVDTLENILLDIAIDIKDSRGKELDVNELGEIIWKSIKDSGIMKGVSDLDGIQSSDNKN